MMSLPLTLPPTSVSAHASMADKSRRFYVNFVNLRRAMKFQEATARRQMKFVLGLIVDWERYLDEVEQAEQAKLETWNLTFEEATERQEKLLQYPAFTNFAEDKVGYPDTDHVTNRFVALSAEVIRAKAGGMLGPVPLTPGFVASILSTVFAHRGDVRPEDRGKVNFLTPGFLQATSSSVFSACCKDFPTDAPLEGDVSSFVTSVRNRYTGNDTRMKGSRARAATPNDAGTDTQGAAGTPAPAAPAAGTGTASPAVVPPAGAAPE